MGSRIYTITVDCHEPRRLAEFWKGMLGYVDAYDDGDEVCIEPKGENESGPALLFGQNPDAKMTKNRIHFDLAPDDQDAEVQRAVSLGASPVDIGQRDVSWVVLADPEGNEFCILSARD